MLSNDSKLYDNAKQFLKSKANWFVKHAEINRRGSRIGLKNGLITKWEANQMNSTAYSYDECAKYWDDIANNYKSKF